MSDWITTTLSIIDKVMDQIPNYSERKRNEFHSLRKKYIEERNKPDEVINDQYLDNLRERLRLFAVDFTKEISTKDDKA